MGDLPSSAGPAAVIASVLGNIIATAIIAYQAKKGSNLEKAKAEAESKAHEATTKASDSSCADLIAAKDAMLAAAKATGDAWKQSCMDWKDQHEKLSVIHEASRKQWHDRNEASNVVMMKLSEENAVLKTQTNLQPIMEALQKIVESQTKISQILCGLCQKLKIDTTEDEQEREKHA